MKKYVCMICGFIYDEAKGHPESGIARGTKWDDIEENWVCPLCGAEKKEFKEQTKNVEDSLNMDSLHLHEQEELRELTIGELSALCSNLARGCEKQYLEEEQTLFTQLAEYYRSKVPNYEPSTTKELISLIEGNLNVQFTNASNVAHAKKDRGALRALVWSEKVTRILNSLLKRLENEETSSLIQSNVYVCTICGFVYVGEVLPELCPVCKVPNWKFTKIGGE